MPPLPSFLALRAFEVAGRAGSFALAAEQLNLTPSAISHQIRTLEGHFEKPLFFRLHRGVVLTTDGERLLQGLSPAFKQVEAACAALFGATAPQALAVHSSPSFASQWLGPRLPIFMRRNPAIGIRLSSGADRIDLAQREEIDVLICYGAAPRRPSVVSHPLGEEDVVALASPAMAARIAAAGDAGWTDAVLIESSLSPVRWGDWLAHNGLPARATGPAFDRGALAVAAAVQELGVALESRRFAGDELASGALVEVGAGRWHPIRRDLHWLCYRESAAQLAKIQIFRTWLRAEASGGDVPVPPRNPRPEA